MRKKPNIGEIIIPFGALPQKHELTIAKTLITTGSNVEFIPVNTHTTPDNQHPRGRASTR